VLKKYKQTLKTYIEQLMHCYRTEPTIGTIYTHELCTYFRHAKLPVHQ